MTVVVDTNVILVANGAHDDVSPECVLECVQRLQQLMQTGSIAIDDAYRILGEYQNKTIPRKGKGVGDLFIKWVLTKLADGQRVHLVPLTELGVDCFAEFPVPALEAVFDRPDRKFAAVANAHPAKPAIWQAADCKWLDWWPELKAQGVDVEFLCGDDICQFYAKKFPKKPLPALP
ncbi:hypothetical protein [Rhodoferax sp.]|uniref:hypothetical protein n=1 Tax=Rhodoferax sp. TaxID=50421 RepID=UPI0025DACB9F|nr:hypothetical protein [Rhodoferax sp.]